MWDYRSLAWRLPSGRVGRNGIVLHRRRRHPTPDELSVFLGISARRKQRLNTLRSALSALTCGIELATPLPIAIPPLVLPHPMAPGSLIPRVRLRRLNFEQINCPGSTMAGSIADNGGGKLLEWKRWRSGSRPQAKVSYWRGAGFGHAGPERALPVESGLGPRLAIRPLVVGRADQSNLLDGLLGPSGFAEQQNRPALCAISAFSPEVIRLVSIDLRAGRRGCV